MTDNNVLEWAPESCELPSIDRPLREGEFDALFRDHLLGGERISSTRAELRLAPASERIARDLVVRESSCCSFFTFDFRTERNLLVLAIDVPPQHVAVLDALTKSALNASSRG